MFSPSISQFCQKIPFCEGAKTVLTENPKAALFTAIGVVGITFIAQRVLRATPAPDGDAPAERSLERSESVIFHPADAPLPTRPPMEADPDEESTGTVLVDGRPLAPAGSSEEARMSAIIHIPSDEDPVAREPSVSPATDGKYGKHRLRKRPSVPPKKKEVLPSARFSTELIEHQSESAMKHGALISSRSPFDISHGNAPLDFRVFQNSHHCEFVIDGCTFQCARAAIRAMQFPGNEKEFERINPQHAINLANHNKELIRNDWATVRDDILLRVIWEKFSQNEDLRAKLLATKDVYLIYQIGEGDCFQVEEGRNKGGEALMRIRAKLGGTGIVERPEVIPPPLEETPPPPPAPRPILQRPGSKPSRAKRFVRWLVPGTNKL